MEINGYIVRTLEAQQDATNPVVNALHGLVVHVATWPSCAPCGRGISDVSWMCQTGPNKACNDYIMTTLLTVANKKTMAHIMAHQGTRHPASGER